MKKTIFDKSALMFIGAICLIAIVVSAFRVIRADNVKCPEIKITLSSSSLTENTPFTASCISPGVSSWDWDFGDGSDHGDKAVMSHTYHSAGKYVIRLTVNGSAKCMRADTVVVGQDRSATSASSGEGGIETSIDGPSTAMVGRPVKFHETSGKATSWAWTSSESKGIDGTGQEITYTFTSPGVKTIYVTINGNKGKASMDVNVAAPAGGGEAKPKITEDAFRKMLTDVVNKKSDVPAFNGILCNLKTVVNFKFGKDKPEQKTFDDFCKDIRGHGYRTEFDQVKLTFDPKGCVSGIDIIMHKGSLRIFMDR